MRKQIWRVLVVTLMVLGGGFFAFKPAAAQEGTTVFFSPDPATIDLNGTNSQVVEVWVGNALNLYSFDIAFTYNPEIALISSWSFGEFFEIEIWACQRTTNNPLFSAGLHSNCPSNAQKRLWGRLPGNV